MHRQIAIVGVVLILGGCASMSEEECRIADWYEVGVRDGRDGQTDARLARHAEACARAAISPDAAAWRAGHREGLLSYCTAESGWRAGRDGRSYQSVCDPDSERDFLYGYDIGHELHRIEQRITALESGIEALERELRDEELTDEQRRERLDRLSRDQRELRDLERQRGDAEAEARNRGFRESRY